MTTTDAADFVVCPDHPDTKTCYQRQKCRTPEAVTNIRKIRKEDKRRTKATTKRKASKPSTPNPNWNRCIGCGMRFTASTDPWAAKVLTSAGNWHSDCMARERRWAAAERADKAGRASRKQSTGKRPTKAERVTAARRKANAA